MTLSAIAIAKGFFRSTPVNTGGCLVCSESFGATLTADSHVYGALDVSGMTILER